MTFSFYSNFKITLTWVSLAGVLTIYSHLGEQLVVSWTLAVRCRVEPQVHLLHKSWLLASLICPPAKCSQKRPLVDDGGLVGYLDRLDMPTIGLIWIAFVDILGLNEITNCKMFLVFFRWFDWPSLMRAMSEMFLVKNILTKSSLPGVKTSSMVFTVWDQWLTLLWDNLNLIKNSFILWEVLKMSIFKNHPFPFLGLSVVFIPYTEHINFRLKVSFIFDIYRSLTRHEFLHLLQSSLLMTQGQEAIQCSAVRTNLQSCQTLNIINIWK